MKVTVTDRADLDARSKFFTTGEAEKLVYTASPRGAPTPARGSGRSRRSSTAAGACGCAGSARTSPTAASERLMVEGGGIVHTQFLTDDLVDELQLVVAPFFVGDSRAPRFVSDGALPVERRAAARRSPRCARSATWCCCATRCHPGSGTTERRRRVGASSTLSRSRRTVRAGQAGPAAGLIAQLLLLAVLAETTGLGAAGRIVGVACALTMAVALARGVARGPGATLGPASWVTLARATLAVGVAALAVDSITHDTPAALLVTLAAVALALDAVDGFVARRTGTASALGARFDGEVDAFLIAALSVYVASASGAWVLAIGAARYVFLAGEWLLPWMRAPLPPRRWRKVVAATQGIVLTVAAAGVLPAALTQALLVAALALLAESFGDTWWLWRRRHATREQVRMGIRVALTVLSLLLVWAALVAPHEPSDFTAGAFARLPLELFVVVALAVVLPATARRVLAVVAGAVLGVLVLVKALDIGFYTAFDRPFDPFDDWSHRGTAVETFRDTFGSSHANLAVAATAVLVVVLFVVLVAAMLRVTRVAAGHRGRALPAVAALGVVCVVLQVAGAPLASTSTTALAVNQVQAVRTGMEDRVTLAGEIARDRFRTTPGDRLLTGLRGKDVLLVFVEAYGKVAVHGSSVSPRIAAVLDQGTADLRAAGFSSRSAFLTSSTFGGLSWLAHSTLQSGVWIDSQRRYNQLVESDRFTLSQAFKRAGWRAVGDVPSNNRTWREGSTFYHYDWVYDSRNVGYRGPRFGYPTMPDQYVLEALQRLELARRHRPSLFAEVDLISSHVPWTRIPRLVPWDDVGDGSVYHRVPTQKTNGGPRRLRSFDRVLAERDLLVRSALRQRRPRARRRGRPSARDDRHRPGRQPRRADLGRRARPEGAGADRGMGLGGRHAAEPGRAGLADERLPRPLPDRVRLVAVKQDDRAPFSLRAGAAARARVGVRPGRVRRAGELHDRRRDPGTGGAGRRRARGRGAGPVLRDRRARAVPHV